MDRNSDTNKEDESIELPPGFRFHPTDEELITHYLLPKVLDARFRALAIGEVDMNKCEPWDLPWRAKMGENEWYFFTVRDQKYPTGPRINRATDSGYWKATGKDKEIYRMKKLVGMKKTLVFYRGRAPKGKKTDWVMHEYRLEGRLPTFDPPKSAKDEWVICRIFQKGAGGETKTSISQMHQKLSPAVLPPLTDSSQCKNSIEAEDMRRSHVTCFSEPVVDSPWRRLQEDTVTDDGTNSLSTADRLLPSESPFRDPTSWSKNHAQIQDSALFHDQSLVRLLLEDHGSTSGGAVDLGFLWKY